MSEWDRIAAADAYAARSLRRMEASERSRTEDRAFSPYNGQVGTGPVVDMAPGYGRIGSGGWQQGMIWQASGAATADSAMRLSAVFGCWRLLSDAISTLPLAAFTQGADGTPTPTVLPGYLQFQPPQMSRILYLCQVVLSILSDGNAFVATPRNELGVPTALIPLAPAMVDVRREHGAKVFRIDGHDYNELDIMHIPWMVMPGNERGISPIQAMRDVIDTSSKAQELGRAFMGNNAVPPAVIEVPDGGTGDPNLERERAVRIGEVWNETHGGTSNAGKVGVLTGGASLKSIALSPEDVQWLDSKRFGVSEIARFYGVPPHLLADASNSTSWGSGLAEQNSAFGQLSLRPFTSRIDEGHSRLMTTDGMPDSFAKLDIDEALKSSFRERVDAAAVATGFHLMTPNEFRKGEKMPPIKGGDEFPDPAGVNPLSVKPKMPSLGP